MESKRSFNSECPFCLNGFEDGDHISLNSCGHAWHQNCRSDALLQSFPFDCPTCRGSLTECAPNVRYSSEAEVVSRQ